MKVIYLSPDYVDVCEFDALTNEEKLNFANNYPNEEEIQIFFDLETFQNQFNIGNISDLGYIYFV